ncbi:hypothetical protein POUND7_020605 [Theobroma cacao]
MKFHPNSTIADDIAAISGNNVGFYRLWYGDDSVGSKSVTGSRRESPAPTDEPNAGNRAQTFTYQELETATNGFRNTSLIGRGGFGPVYKGQLGSTGQTSIMGLKVRTPGQKPLDWNTRLTIAAGAAKGLEYLHSGANPPVLCRDLTSSNILLGEGFHPKLSDFGLAKFGPSGDKSHVSTRIMGTRGYCAPEYLSSGKLSMKSDIFSFGVVLLELITGRKAHDITSAPDERYLVNWALPMLRDAKKILSLADPVLRGHFPRPTLRRVLEVASMCIQENANSRPSIGDVVLALNYLASRPYDPNEGNRVDVRARGPEIRESPTMAFDRERAVARAMEWGRRCREKRRQSGENVSGGSNRSKLKTFLELNQHERGTPCA